ncbi:LuxR C-terminal-related transcriptional regulator [uncultured Draconibacterium sp.]|uniref:LuxR C-terminal-related transcriptional regulator n=1 Tax=uncultured Draconibacterium sp. TaxID=1573823 RepID=UPI0029C9A155|nr:LuxR C-terminal-related transcriptional regulator [uncultured Draconibacterium sp.]
MRPSFRILLVLSKSELLNQLITLLQSETYIIETANTAEAAKLKIEDQYYDLIICQQTLSNTSGFRFYKQLEEKFFQDSTGFFLIVEDYSVEDLQLGLELGIDNFLFCPISRISLLNKVEKRLQKSLQFNYYGTEGFRMHFLSSPVPMFFSESFKITEVNDSFTRLFDGLEHSKAGFFDIFDLKDDETNRLKLRKLENGLVDNCWLEDVNAVRLNGKFNLYKNSIGDKNKNKFLTVILPTSQHENGGSQHDDECLVQGKCMKNRKKDFGSIQIVHLTAREQEVFTLSARGIPIKQIAVELNISERTIEKHRSNIMKKTDTHSMMEAILKIQKQQVLYSIA